MAFSAPTSQPFRKTDKDPIGQPFRQRATRCALHGNSDAPRTSRRQFAKLLATVALSLSSSCVPQEAAAMPGLQLFPLSEPLANSYYLMRAGESVSDAKGIAKSNPVEKLSVQAHGLTRKGIQQVLEAARKLRAANVEYDVWLWPSTSFNAMETAEILAYELNIRREQVVPEYSFLDARGLGNLDGSPVSLVQSTLAALDTSNIDKRPEAGEDGTPNDSVSDVFVRVRQLLSKLETQYSGERIVIIAPDSHSLSVLQAALMDVDLHEHSRFNFAPGEIRRIHEKVVKRPDPRFRTVDEVLRG